MKKIAFTLLSFICIVALTKCNSRSSKSNSSSDSTSISTSTSTDTSNITADWKIGVQMWTFRVFTFAEALDKVDSAGVKYIEAFWGQPLGAGMKDSFGVRMSDESKAKLKEMMKSKGISMVAMGVIVPKTREEWKQAFDLAKEFGLSYITAEPLKNQWDMVDSMAGTYGIKVAIHDHPKPNAYWSPDSVLAATVGHPNIGSCADLGHWARNGVNPVDALKKLEGHVFGVHLKDITKFGDTHAADTVVGKGVIDFPPIFQELKRQHFKGMFSIEHESNWYHSLPDVIETVKFYNEQVAKLK
ncbi:MAG TPA: sugar phosphate isomerase/epimerase [Hanamia sp.]|jgi:sugar phosphate isomerase/epimerase|nr:sugar phosphate isomerase/epimerase [Hanamia sp.]